MRSSIVIDKINNQGFLIKNNPVEILKNIFNIEGNFEIVEGQNEYLVYCNNNKLCNFNVTYEEICDYVININYKGVSYHYFCDEEKERLRLKLMDYCFDKEEKNIRIANYEYATDAEITKGNKGIAIEIEEKNINTKMFEIIVSSLNFEDSIEKIYNRLSVLSSNNNIKIKKYIKLNTCDYREKITDLLIIRDGNLEEYITSVNTNINGSELNYILKKGINGYSVSFFNNSIETIQSSYLALNNQVDFVKKIEKKNKVLTKQLK